MDDKLGRWGGGRAHRLGTSEIGALVRQMSLQENVNERTSPISSWCARSPEVLGVEEREEEEGVDERTGLGCGAGALVHQMSLQENVNERTSPISSWCARSPEVLGVEEREEEEGVDERTGLGCGAGALVHQMSLQENVNERTSPISSWCARSPEVLGAEEREEEEGVVDVGGGRAHRLRVWILCARPPEGSRQESSGHGSKSVLR